VVPEDELHHLVRVRRARRGDRFLGLDGNGKVYLCRLERAREGWYGSVLEELEKQGTSALQVTLAQALIKKSKFEWVLQKATEIGVSEIVPLITVRTQLRLNPEREETRMKRWRKILLEAVKQCGRPHVPKLAHPIALEGFLDGASAELKLVLDEKGEFSLKELLRENQQVTSCLVIVGPEGGWDETDRELFRQKKVPSVSLGARILRAETAPVTILSILQYELGDLSP
jgi:16S rRNA (uracil1498-N3)-methyltransferase